jgi:GNAT superfamily N-acetyltransferase
VALVERGKILAVATIAPQGEEGSDEPTIVALYTHPQLRGRGYGRQAFLAAIKRCRERGFPHVRVDVTSARAMKIIRSLTKEDQAFLKVVNWDDMMGGLDTLLGEK